MGAQFRASRRTARGDQHPKSVAKKLRELEAYPTFRYLEVPATVSVVEDLRQTATGAAGQAKSERKFSCRCLRGAAAPGRGAGRPFSAQGYLRGFACRVYPPESGRGVAAGSPARDASGTRRRAARLTFERPTCSTVMRSPPQTSSSWSRVCALDPDAAAMPARVAFPSALGRRACRRFSQRQDRLCPARLSGPSLPLRGLLATPGATEADCCRGSVLKHAS